MQFYFPWNPHLLLLPSPPLPHSIHTHTHTQAVDVTKTQLQLVGVTALLIAAKYEEVYPPSIQDFAYITAHTYSTKEIRDMERKMLRQLNYRLNKPLPIHFLRRYSKVGDANTKEHNLTKYILELSFLDASMSSMLPSKRAAGAFLLAQSLLHKKTPQQLWTPTLAYYSEYTFSDLLEVKRKLQKALKDGHTSKRFLVVREKYASANFLKVSALPVLQDLWCLWTNPFIFVCTYTVCILCVCACMFLPLNSLLEIKLFSIYQQFSECMQEDLRWVSYTVGKGFELSRYSNKHAAMKPSTSKPPLPCSLCLPSPH